MGAVRVLAALAMVASGCLLDIDYGGTHFRCAETELCPAGYACVEGACVEGPMSDAGRAADAAAALPDSATGYPDGLATFACDSPVIDIEPGVTHAGTTVGGQTGHAGQCVDTSGPEVIHRLILTGDQVPATVRATTDLPGTNYDAVLYARTGCEETDSELACNDEGQGDTVAFAVTEPGAYYLFVDSHDGGAGNYQLLASLE